MRGFFTNSASWPPLRGDGKFASWLPLRGESSFASRRGIGGGLVCFSLGKPVNRQNESFRLTAVPECLGPPSLPRLAAGAPAVERIP